MTIRDVQWIDSTGKTLFWYPDATLANWTTSRVAATERSAPNLGIYDASLDDTISKDWYLFEGDSQPASWDAALTNLELDGAVETTEEDTTPTPENELAALSQGYGPRRVKTPNMDVEQFDPRVLQAADDRQNATYPTIADFGMAIASPNCTKYRR
jgi:hypothetical protein